MKVTKGIPAQVLMQLYIYNPSLSDASPKKPIPHLVVHGINPA